MKVNVERKENNTIKLNIEIDADIAAQEYNKACKKIGDNITIPGFRKGKAPRSMVEKYVGAEKIHKEALDKVLPGIFADTISEHQFDLATEPVVESYQYTLGEPLKVIAKIEVKPDVTLNDYKGLKVEVPEFRHPEDVLERELKTLAEKFTALEPVIGRPCDKNDIVVIDYSGTINGEPIKGGSSKKLSA